MNNRFKIFFSLAGLYALLIFYLSSRSSLGDPVALLKFLDLESLKNIIASIEQSEFKFLLYPLYIASKYPDKMEHIILYAGFGILLYLTLKNSSNNTLRKYAFMLAIIIGTAYGATDEFHQSFVPGRTASLADLFADSIGVTIAQAIIFIKSKVPGHSKKKASTLDLKLAVLMIVLSVLFVLIPPFNQTFLRIPIALIMLLFLPGYLFITVMFPKRSELSSIERFTLSIGLSIAITVFDGFALNYTPWEFRPNSIVFSISIIMLLLLTVAFIQRRRAGENAYEFSIENIRTFFRTLRTKETGQEYDPALEKTLIITMVLAILIVIAMLIYAKVTREPETFTALYILGSNGKAENYPEEIYINRPEKLLVGVENYENQTINYTLRVQLDGKILKEMPINLEKNTRWLENVTFTPVMTSSIALSGIAGKDTKSKLEFILLKEDYPYRSVHLWVRTKFDITDLASTMMLDNGNMEKIAGWNFTSSNESITGTYTTNTWFSPSHSYEINFTINTSREFGEFYQNITSDRDSLVSISFYVKDSYPNINTNVTKQVLLNNSVVWESGLGNNTWEQVQVPVFVSKSTRLAFRVMNRNPVNDTFQVWWDDIKIEPYSSRYISKPVALNNYSQLEFKIRGMPFPLKGNVTIDGRNFPGFYYNIDENISYEKLILIFSDNNTVKAGDATYISGVHGNEISIMGIDYKLLNKTDIGNLSKVLLKNTEKILDLNEKWNLENDYSLTLKLLSTKGDSAQLELRKGGRLLDSRLINRGGVFEYRTNVAKKNTYTIFKTRINSITYDSITVVETELYSDSPTTIKSGDTLGDFEVTNFSSASIVMKNLEPFKIDDGSIILGGSIKFRVIDDTAFPYSASGEMRGIPQTILPGSLMDINGLNYPAFYFDFDSNTSLEELDMHFSYNETVDIGEAVYRTKNNGDMIYFLGNSYWIQNPKRVNILSGYSTIKKTILRNSSFHFENGYTLSLMEKPENGIGIIIRKDISKSDFTLINETNFSGAFSSAYYEMFTTTFHKGRLKSNVVYEKDDEFQYWIEYQEDRKYMLFSGRIEAIDDQNITMELNVYQKPIELLPGMTFGDFEIESIAEGTISMRNIKPIKLENGKEISLLGAAIRIRTSAKEPVAYPLAEK